MGSRYFFTVKYRRFSNAIESKGYEILATDITDRAYGSQQDFLLAILNDLE